MKPQFEFMDRDSKMYVQRNKDKPSDTFNNRKTIKLGIYKNIWSFEPCYDVHFMLNFPDLVKLSCSR